MSIASADLFGLLTTQADLNYFTQQLTIWNARYQANADRLSDMQKYEEKYEGYYDDVQSMSKECKYGSKIYVQKTKVDNNDKYSLGSGFSNIDEAATAYAHAKAPKYDEALLEELMELDMNYDTIKTTLEAKVELLKAQKESEKTNLQTACQDTGTLGGA